MASCKNCGENLWEGARFCASCGEPVPATDPVVERKVATILFADLEGSTQLGERLDPERLRSLLTTYFDAMAECIDAWGGTVEKYIGDAIVAVFGVPVAQGNDPERALRTSLDMLNRLDDLNVRFEERYGVTLNLRIGVNTGEVVAPASPTGQKVVTGDAVNVAARLEQAAGVGEVLVGHRTYLATRNTFSFGSLSDLSLKGKSQPISAWRLMSALSEEERGIPGVRADLVGRSDELGALLAMVEKVAHAAAPRFVGVLGPAGIGKTRLIAELISKSRSRHANLRIFKGRCLAGGRGATYWPLAEVLREIAAISLDHSAGIAYDKLRRTVGSVLRSRPDGRDGTHTLHALALTLGIPVEDNPLEQMAPEAVVDEIANAWAALLSAYAAEAPTLLILEDMHWADEALLAMVQALFTRSNGHLLIAVTARPEFTPPSSVDIEVIHVDPLAEEQSDSLIRSLLRGVDLPERLHADMVMKAGGNPFFLEEMIRRLIDEGAVVQTEGGFEVTNAAGEVVLPDTVQGLLAARIDALPGAEKRTLQEASVVGRIFWDGPISKILTDVDALASLRSLEEKGLIYARSSSSLGGNREFSFKHALVRDVAYSSLALVRRAHAHAEVGAWIDDLAGDREDEFAELIAHHYATAVSGEGSDFAWDDAAEERDRIRSKAFEALLVAGAAARKRFAIGRAIELHERAISLAADADDRARADEELGDDHEAAMHGDLAMVPYQAALQYARTKGHGSAIARLCAKKVAMMTKSGTFSTSPDPAVAEALVEEGLQNVKDERVRALLLALKAGCFDIWFAAGKTPSDDIAERMEAVEEALEIASRLEDHHLMFRATEAQASIYAFTRRPRDELAVHRKQITHLLHRLSRRDQAWILHMTALGEADHFGDYPRSLELARRAYELVREVNAHEMMHATSLAIHAAYHTGAWDEAFSLLDVHLAAYRSESDVSCSMVRSGPLFGALLHAHKGEFDRALELADLVPPLPHKRPAFSDWIKAQVALAMGSHDDALTICERTLDQTQDPAWRVVFLAQAIDALVWQEDWNRLRELTDQARLLADMLAIVVPIADRAEGMCLKASGEVDSARERLTLALRRFDAMPSVLEAARTREQLAKVDGGDQGQDHLKAALVTYERLEARDHAERVRSALQMPKGLPR